MMSPTISSLYYLPTLNPIYYVEVGLKNFTISIFLYKKNSYLKEEDVTLDGVAAQELVDGHLAFLTHTVDPVTSLII
jgi:hypothetical protein